MARTLAHVVNGHQIGMLPAKVGLQANDGRYLSPSRIESSGPSRGNDFYRPKLTGRLIGSQPHFTKSTFPDGPNEVEPRHFWRSAAIRRRRLACDITHRSEDPRRDCMVCSSRVIMERSMSGFGHIASVSFTRW